MKKPAVVFAYTEELVKKAIGAGLAQENDRLYLRNRVLSLLGEIDFTEPAENVSALPIPDLAERLTEEAVQRGLVPPFLEDRDRFAAELMNVFLSKPSEIAAEFRARYKQSPKMATDFFYGLSRASNYIQVKRIAKNVTYQAPTKYGELDITINLSKPEKDPAEIARARQQAAPQTNYPKCLLCEENEGYAGHAQHPARANHRTVPVRLEEEEWKMQYSPYLYYNEHCILLSKQHRDMKIDRAGFARLLDFVHQFPHYFAGSNADLPIVGGSILTHDHYQGGRFEFAMAKAAEMAPFTMEDFPEVEAATLHWPLSVIRLRSQNRAALADAAGSVLEAWKNYSDESIGIRAHTGQVPHNTITPIARRRGKRFELDLVLRNNRATSEHPLGLFHPHADIHHIKKENIGLIEVMGLAVLPARLKKDLTDVAAFVAGAPVQPKAEHLAWAQELRETYDGSADAESVVRQAVADKFVRGLEHCGVFKQTEAGQAALQKFVRRIQMIGMK